MSIIFKSIYSAKNQGHGIARRLSLSNCTNELVALMDADDICLQCRFELQLRKFIQDNSLSVVGGQIAEFEEINITGIRRVPCKHEEIKQLLKKRCPMNQVSVMFKKSDVEQSGGYQDWYCNEDYFLWVRMLDAGYIFANVPEVLVNVRIGKDMASRRGGWHYFTSEARLQLYMLKKSVISLPRWLYNTVLRLGGEVLMPTAIRKLAFKLFREHPFQTSFSFTQQKFSLTERNAFSFTEEKIKYPPFSVAICVYGKDNPEWFDTALESIIINQTVKPSEVVLVVDGPIPETIQLVIDKYKKICQYISGE